MSKEYIKNQRNQVKRTRRNKYKYAFVSKLNDYRHNLDKWTLGRTYTIGDYIIYMILRNGPLIISRKELGRFFDLTKRNAGECVDVLVREKILKKRKTFQLWNNKYNGPSKYFLGDVLYDKAKLEILCEYMPALKDFLEFANYAAKVANKNGTRLPKKRGKWLFKGRFNTWRVKNKIRGGTLSMNTRVLKINSQYISLIPNSYSFEAYMLKRYVYCKHGEVEEYAFEKPPTYEKLKERAIEKVSTTTRAVKKVEPVTLSPKALQFLKSAGYKFENGALEHV